jgi:hypothetical protein
MLPWGNPSKNGDSDSCGFALHLWFCQERIELVPLKGSLPTIDIIPTEW